LTTTNINNYIKENGGNNAKDTTSNKNKILTNNNSHHAKCIPGYGIPLAEYEDTAHRPHKKSPGTILPRAG